jgi:AraC-like DNA-binding protein/RimJ/RimL family protein N-acetyltransferase
MDYRPTLQRIISTIESSLEDDIDLSQLSKQAHISVYHFSRLFVVYTGLSPMEYVCRRRLFHAAAAVQAGEEILPIAIRYGYSSHSAFSKAFKKVFGCTPRIYRKVGIHPKRPCINLYTQETILGGQIIKAYETERLVIRNFKYDDWKAIQALAINKESSRYARYDVTWPTTDNGCKETAKFLAGNDSFWAVCLKENGLLIGLIAYNGIDENRTLDIGHLFHTDYMSEEITTEALRRMVQYAFDELEISRITTHNAADWKGQIEPLRRLGMKKTGEITDTFSADSDKTSFKFNTYILGITRKEWENLNKPSAS